ncbi:MAG: hypothetical protein HYZ42_05860 [Bacteroidetes bacterium]|nr:hypothetical protein [Bacteroidota bacterium]
MTFHACSDEVEHQSLVTYDTIQAKEVTKVDSLTESATWADSLILIYMQANKDRFTEVDGQEVTYMKETTERNGRGYIFVNIGHSFESRYLSDQWIYIDSLTKEIYEYDLPNDSLMLWLDSN